MKRDQPQKVPFSDKNWPESAMRKEIPDDRQAIRSGLLAQGRRFPAGACLAILMVESADLVDIESMNGAGAFSIECT
ncbi:hypothetical protein [Novosphingobium sp. PP1Y]|jgi:hypothetical protein|uniref:hypothetical protein n=1 Tax=Novosphingobium sp. PP1Y TaxID=702113 RepID=UPI0011D22693|nr:hypothetical protein [Novosphingobium sp. PP1Y]